MKSFMKLSLAFLLLFGLSIPASSVDAKAKTYRNCKELNKAYKGGVAKSKSVKNKGGKTYYRPYVSASLYRANATKDRDKDGIACER